MRFKKLVSAAAALALSATAFAGLGTQALADDYDITDLVDTESTSSTYYDSSTGQIIYPQYNGVDKTGYIYLKTPIDISGGDNGDTVTISFNMAYTTKGYNPHAKCHRTMTFLDSSDSTVMPIVYEYNYAKINFGSVSDDEDDTGLGSATQVDIGTATGGTECIITVRTNSDGERVAQMQVGTNYSDESVITGNEIKTIELAIGDNISQSDRWLYVNDFKVSIETAVTTYSVTFSESSGADISVTVYSDEDKTIVVNPAALEPGMYYYTATATGYEDKEGYFTIVDENVIETFSMDPITQIEATVNAVISGTETSIGTYTNSGYDSVRVYYPKYIKYNNEYYVISANDSYPSYAIDFTATETKNIDYTLDSKVAFYGEETDLHLSRSFAATDILVERMSMGNCGRLYASNYGYTDVIDSVNDAIYTVTVNARNVSSNTSTLPLAIRDADGNITSVKDSDGNIVSLSFQGNGPYDNTNEVQVTIPAGCSLVFDNRSNSGNSNLAIDYFVLSNKTIIPSISATYLTSLVPLTKSELTGLEAVSEDADVDDLGSTFDVTSVAITVTNYDETLGNPELYIDGEETALEASDTENSIKYFYTNSDGTAFFLYQIVGTATPTSITLYNGTYTGTITAE